MMRSAPIVLAIVALGIAISGVDGNEKIFRGREVEPLSRPWMAWLLIGQQRVQCGAALIHRKFVLTAASCVLQPITSVILGDHDRDVDEGTEQIFNAKSITIHPEHGAHFKNDIAIIELAGRADVDGPAVSVIPVLPNDTLTERIYSKHCRVCGWGFQAMGISGRIADQTNLLLEYTADVTTTGNCTDDSLSTKTAVCYEPFRDPDALTCEGDAGGPMICRRKRVWNLAGIVTGFDSTDGCMTGLKAATKITLFNEWIDSVINA